MGALIKIFTTSLIVAFSGAIMPGPLLTITISESAKNGSWSGPKLIAGHAVLELVLVISIIFGLSPILKNEIFFVIVALTGGAIMIWMSWGMFKSLPMLSLDAQSISKKGSNIYLSGILMSLANPYWIIWWATIGLGYILNSVKFGVFGVIMFFIGHILGDLIWYSAISVAVGKGRRLFTNKVYRILVGACASFLLLFAIWLIYDGIIYIKIL